MEYNEQTKKKIDGFFDDISPEELFRVSIEECGFKEAYDSSKPDPKYIGIPNISYSIVGSDDDRDEEYKVDRINRGFDDSETWCLGTTTLEFLLPRLKRYQEIHKRFMDNEKFNHEIVELIVKIEIYLGDTGDMELMMEIWEDLGEIAPGLWW